MRPTAAASAGADERPHAGSVVDAGAGGATPGLARARLAVVVAAVLWSLGGLFIKLVPLDAMGVTVWRSSITLAFLWLVLRPSPSRLARASPSTAISYAAMILTFVAATKLTTAANAIFLQYTGPLYVVALSPLVLREPFARRDGVALAVALVGLGFFFSGKLERGHQLGNLLGLVSGLFFAGTVMFLRRDRGRDALASLLAGNALAALVALPFAWGRLALEPRGLAFAVVLGVVQMGVSYLLFVWALRRVSAVEASLLGMLEPVLNPLWAFLGVGERPAPLALVGGALVLVAVSARALAPGLRRAPASGRAPRAGDPRDRDEPPPCP
jgi:drug/metabolite transporter (DMT)-like permease